MGERFTADSVMTPDGEVMPLGPVDKDGRKVSLSTATLFADSGMECTVKRYEYLLGAGVWRACCDEGVVRVDEMHLTCPDTFGALMNDIEAAMNCPASEEPTHAYNVVSGMCDACADRPAARCARRGRSTASATAFTPCSRVMANELLLLRRLANRVSSFCAWPRRPKLVCGFHDLDAPIRRRADCHGRAGYQR